MALIDTRSRLLAGAFVATGLALAFHALHALFGLGGSSLDGFTKDGVYTAVEVVAAGVCVARVRSRREARAAWRLSAAGLPAWSAAALVGPSGLNNPANPPYPSLA